MGTTLIAEPGHGYSWREPGHGYSWWEKRCSCQGSAELW